MLERLKNEPLKFAFDPDKALRQGVRAKPARNWKKAVKSKRGKK
jgi:hypothetical protein